MSKKHFVLLARILRECKPCDGGKHYVALVLFWRALVEKFAYELQTTNPLFEQGRFYDACEYIAGDDEPIPPIQITQVN